MTTTKTTATKADVCFEIGKVYQSNESKSFTCQIISRTKCYVTVAFFVDGKEDWMFKGNGKHKILKINGREYFDTALHSYYPNLV